MYAKSGRFLVDDGDLFFESVGEGEAVVFLHGFGLDSRMWDPQFEVLQSTFRVIRYDFRGFGRSSLPPHNGYAHEDDLNALLSDLGSAPAHVVGLSMGGMMALRFAVAYPQSVRSLVLADSAGLVIFLFDTVHCAGLVPLPEKKIIGARKREKRCAQCVLYPASVAASTDFFPRTTLQNLPAL
jgi:pimeloyl-ACP methyl ester carboxylesterase